MKSQLLLAGVDEAGRGPLFGPVVSAAVILPNKNTINGLTDSKRLSSNKLIDIYKCIYDVALAVSVAESSVEEIDGLNIHHATLLAMKRAVEGLSVSPHELRIDGRFSPPTDYPSQAIVGGDLTVPCISAASVVAKVTRDRLIVAMSEHYPGYGLAEHKGYPTKRHIDAIRQYGHTRHHRKSFEPIKSMVAAKGCSL